MATIPEQELREIVDSKDLAESKQFNMYDAHEQGIAKLRLLWNRRSLLAKGFFCGLIVFTCIAFIIPKRYESTTCLMPPDNQSGSGLAIAQALAGKMSGGLGGLAGDVLGLKSSGELFVGILRSRTVEDDLIDKFDLKKVYGQSLSMGARKTLSANTVISEDRHSGIITITVTDKSPQRAEAMASEYVNELNLVVSQLTTSSARRERIFLEERLDHVKKDLESAEKEFGDFSSKSMAIDVKEQARAMVGAAATLQGQLIAAESELQGLKQIYADSNVRIRSLNARIAELHSQLDKLGGKDESGTPVGTDPKDGDSLYPSIRKLPELGVQFADLYRRTKVQEAVYETLTQEYELAKVAEAKEIPSVKVLDKADIPEHKAFPPRLLIIFLGTFFGVGWIMIWIFGENYWRQLHPEDPRKLFIQEITQTINAKMPWSPPNDSRFHAASHKLWLRLVK